MVESFEESSSVSGSEREDGGDGSGSSVGVDGCGFFSSELWWSSSGGIDMGGPHISVSGLDALSHLGKVLGLGVTSRGGSDSACLRVSPSSSD